MSTKRVVLTVLAAFVVLVGVWVYFPITIHLILN